MQQVSRNFFLHIFGCILFMFMPIFFAPDFNSEFNLVLGPQFNRAILTTFLLLLFFYLNYYYLIPRLYISKKYLLFFGAVFICFLIVFFLPSVNIFIGGHPPLDPLNRPKPSFINKLTHELPQFIGVVIFSMLLKLRELLKETQKEKASAELLYLKAQINPHFLFNTLNSVYSLAIMKSDKTADSIAKISSMMRYVLNESGLDFVPLEKEKEYLDNYIDLQTIRLSKNVKLFYSWNGYCDNLKIAPLILIPFIENAFKHGVNSEEESNIIIEIVVLKNEISLIVKNKIVSKNIEDIDKSGLGINNTKMRLNLLYPKNHHLQITNDNVFHIVDLKIIIHD